MSKNKFLITGGAGFIGSNLISTIQERYPDATIFVIDDFSSGHFSNLRNFQGTLFADNILNCNFLSEVKDELTAVFHLASCTDTTNHDQLFQLQNNLSAFQVLFYFCINNNIPLIYASSAAVYGNVNHASKETDIFCPLNAYAFSKSQMDNHAHVILNKFPDFKIIGLRFFNVYGPNEQYKGKSSSMISQLYNQMMNHERPRIYPTGEQQRDHIYVKDVVDLLLLAEQTNARGIFNCGTGTAEPFLNIVKNLNEGLGTDLEPQFIANPHGQKYQNFTCADMTKTKDVFNWQAKYNLDSGIEDYLKNIC